MKKATYYMSIIAMALIATKSLLLFAASKLNGVDIVVIAIGLFVLALSTIFMLFRATCARDGGCNIWSKVLSFFFMVYAFFDVLLPAIAYMFIDLSIKPAQPDVNTY